jgi:phosphoribosylglycinamide formyltransferase-1
MYGHHVHEAVINAKDPLSGITVHYVNEHYDEGNIIFQATCDVAPSDTPADLEKKVHALEYEHYPRVIEEILFAR